MRGIGIAMSDNSQLELIRQAAAQPPYKQVVYVNAGQLLAEIEREYLPKQRFDDGEVVKIGDMVDWSFGERKGEAKRVVDMRVSVDLSGQCGTSASVLKRPDPEVLDADGVPIVVGDTVWMTYYGKDEKKVTEVLPYGFGKSGQPCVRYESGGWDEARDVTHKQPDSLERIEEDALMASTDYCDKYGLLDSGCNAEEGDGAVRHCTDCGLTCEKRMTKHLLRRQREVLECGR